MAKPRKQTYTMDMYLDKMKDKDIRSDADVQRLAGQWQSGQINELIFTVLTEDYIPPIILGEEKKSQLWIIDGLQRSTSLMRYRYGNYKISSGIEESVISYRAKKKDKNGKILEDENGDIIWEDIEFNIKSKTYEDLPEELKKRFNEYQIETVIHEDCDMNRISKLIKRYNNHTSMNAAQKAFTNLENYAREVREILDTDFFSKFDIFTETERTKGTLERVVLESVMCMFHFEEWKASPTSVAKYLNKNATKEEFVKLNDNLQRLGVVMSDDIKDIFTTKDSFIWLTFYNEFVDLGFGDNRFVDFLKEFKNGLREKRVNGELFDEVDKKGSTKDKAVIAAKLQILEALLYDYLDIRKSDLEETDVLKFVKENVSSDMIEEDIDLYEDCLNDLTLNVDNNTHLLDKQNHASLIAIIAYACDKDIYMDSWFVEFFKRNHTYMLNQKDNYLHMKADIEKYIADEEKSWHKV